MKKLSLFLCVSFCFASTLHAQVPTEGTKIANPIILGEKASPVQAVPEIKAGGGIMTFEEEKFDFGSVEDGFKVVHDFIFKNTGTEPVVISNVKASCGCTTPSWSKEPIAPGESGKISAAFNSKGRVGSVNKAVTITSNASTPTKQLFLIGKVTPAPAPVMAPEKAPSMLSEPKN